ncbi:hypothetical protein L2E81_23320 [Planktothrix agardhii 1033]|nr:hypothetical protein [Planktothrix agardhii 1033]MCF3609361.1 hypothetical protein [Planktothrix agardhii 1033]
MTIILTYFDSGVLIAAARGTDIVSLKANSILDSKQRQFCSSYFVRLEILTKAASNCGIKGCQFRVTLDCSASIGITIRRIRDGLYYIVFQEYFYH